jgi:hypothetical protein
VAGLAAAVLRAGAAFAAGLAAAVLRAGAAFAAGLAAAVLRAGAAVFTAGFFATGLFATVGLRVAGAFTAGFFVAGVAELLSAAAAFPAEDFFPADCATDVVAGLRDTDFLTGFVFMYQDSKID